MLQPRPFHRYRAISRITSAALAVAWLAAAAPASALENFALSGNLSYQATVTDTLIDTDCYELGTPDIFTCALGQPTTVMGSDMIDPAAHSLPYVGSLSWPGYDYTSTFTQTVTPKDGQIRVRNRVDARSACGYEDVPGAPPTFHFIQDDVYATSDLRVEFDVEQVDYYGLHGTFTGVPVADVNHVGGLVRLSTESGTKLDEVILQIPPQCDLSEAFTCEGSFEFQGILQPGRYVLEVEADGGANCYTGLIFPFPIDGRTSWDVDLFVGFWFVPATSPGWLAGVLGAVALATAWRFRPLRA